MTQLNSKPASIALVIGHVAGMIDMAALPIWVGTLIAAYGLTPAVAGGMVTLFLGGIVVASLIASVIFMRLRPRLVAPFGYLVAAGTFVALSQITDPGLLAALHLLAGLAAGFGLSATHGAMGLTANPMKIFGWGGAALGLGAILFLGGAPAVIDAWGREMIFICLAGVIGVAGLVTLLFFPEVRLRHEEHRVGAGFGPQVWFPVIGVLLMALLQAMMFSFVERIGVERAFPQEVVRLTLMLVGVVNMGPGLLAAALQRRLPPMGVAVFGALMQAALGFGVASVGVDWGYVVLVLLFPPMMLFTHTFVFGYLTRIDPTGRAVTATPAMIMTGSAVGPLLGGLVVQSEGYQGLGLTALAIGVLTVSCFSLAIRAARQTTLRAERPTA